MSAQRITHTQFEILSTPSIPAFSRGITLIELLITLAVSSTLMSLAVPVYSDLTQNAQLTTQANLLLQNLVYSRSEALRRNMQVTMCKSASGISCSTDATEHWDAGWLIFEDQDADGVLDNGEEIIRIQTALADNLSLISGNTISHWVAYSFTGAVHGSGGSGKDSFSLCDSRSDTTKARTISINATGRARVSVGSTSCPA